jgi:hypothetical protein
VPANRKAQSGRFARFRIEIASPAQEKELAQ